MTKNEWWVYVLRCADGSLYTGVTTNVERRLREHNGSKRGAKYTRSRRPVSLLGSLKCSSRSEALKMEHQVKSMTRAAKLWLVESWRASDRL
jgi:putative endonuclease